MPKNGKKKAKHRNRVRELLIQRNFDGTDPIPVLGLLQDLQQACNQNRIHDGGDRCLMKRFTHGDPEALVQMRLGTPEADQST